MWRAINRRKFLTLAGSTLIAACGGGGVKTAPEEAPPAASSPAAAPSPATAPAPGPAQTSRLSPEEQKRQAEERVGAYMRAHGVPGAAIALVYHTSPSAPWQTEYLNLGLASKATGQAMTESTIVLTNSITKLFTSSLLAHYVNRGLVRLDDPLQKFLTEITVPSFNGTPITLEQLATHFSGLPINTPGQATGTVEQVLVRSLADYKLTRAPGAEYEYANYPYALLGLTLARVGKASYGDLLQREILEPLAMPDSRFMITPALQTRLAVNYAQDGEVVPLRPIEISTGAAGGLLSTTTEQVRFLMANMDSGSTPLGSAFTLAQKRYGTAFGRGVGLGWEIEFPGTPREAFWKNGGGSGASSQMWFSRGAGFGLVVLTNRGPAPVGRAAAGSHPGAEILAEVRQIIASNRR